MTIYAEIAVNVPQVRGVFHYHLPETLEGRVGAGHLVLVPFGKQTVQGVVLGTMAQAQVSETRAVLELVDPYPVLTPQLLKLAGKLTHQTLSPLAACIDVMLPPGLSRQAEIQYSLPEGRSRDGNIGDLSDLHTRILQMLERQGALRTAQFERAFARVNWRQAMQALVRRGFVLTESILPQAAARPKVVRTAQISASPEEVEVAWDSLGRAGTAVLERRQKMLRFLSQEGIPVRVSWVYAESGGNLVDLKALAERDLVVLSENEVWRDPLEGIRAEIREPVQLTRAQQVVWETVITALADPPGKPVLLHGVTGSGKTEIYLHAVEKTVKSGRQAIILVPEIALTPQTVRRFLSRFPGRVGLVHSKLSQGERYDTWRRARRGLLSVVVGPRSALFTPLPDPGLIVIDEEHDQSYYNAEMPAFHARELAVEYARLCRAVCLLGSATPDVVSYARAERGQYVLQTLPERIMGHSRTVQAVAQKWKVTPRYRPLEGEASTIELPPVDTVDMRDELRAGNSSIFSRSLQEALGQTLERQEQAILFLNRLGSATYVFCRDCGHNLHCPRCEMPLTYHAGSAALVCHRCGYTRQMPKTCPNCGSKRIKQFGTGTETVEDEFKKFFPKAQVLRWDRTTTQKKDAHEVILAHFANHRADVLVGTQMLAKGLDLPLVTLVGVILAEVGLNLPDYRAPERVFQVLTQVAGRAGRGLLGGRVILQTFQPEAYAIQAAARHDYAAFYRKELAYRQELNNPPYSHLARLEVRSSNPRQAEEQAQNLARQVRVWLAESHARNTEMIGPAPCYFGKLNGMYRWQVILNGPNPTEVLKDRLRGEIFLEFDPPSLL